MGVDFVGVDLVGIDLVGMNPLTHSTGSFQNVNSLNVNSQNVNFLNVNSQNVNFLNVNAQNVNFLNVNAQNVNFLNDNSQNVNSSDIWEVVIFGVDILGVETNSILPYRLVSQHLNEAVSLATRRWSSSSWELGPILTYRTR